MFQLLGTENRTNFGKNETTEINDIVILYVLEHKGSDEPRMEQLIIGQLVCRRTINLLFILNDLCGQGQLRWKIADGTGVALAPYYIIALTDSLCWKKLAPFHQAHIQYAWTHFTSNMTVT